MKFLLKSLIVVAGLGLATLTYAQVPQVTTMGTQDRTENSVTLQGEVRLTSEFPFGRVLFEYGRTTNYGNSTGTRNVTESGSFEQTIGGLNPNRGYNFRAVLVASDGQEYYGQNRTFITTSDNDENPDVPPQGSNPDQVVDSAELDSDNDGVPDSVECPGIEDGAICPDTDNDGRSDRFDTDSDNDGILDGQDENRLTNDDPESSITNSDGDETEGTGVTVGETPSVGGGGLIVNRPDETPEGTQAQGEVSGEKLVPCDGADCKFSSLIILIERIIRFLIYLTIFATVATFIYSGFIFMTKGDIATARGESKKMALNAAKGLLLTLFAWLIITSILTLLTDTGDDEGDVNTDRFLQE